MDCQSGCTVPREHLATCTDPETCRGCMPRAADDGVAVCRSCRGRLHDALVRIPDLVEHIRAHVVPGSRAGDGVHVRGTRTPPAPLSLAAVDDADALHSALAEWCTEVMDGRDVRGPSWAGSMVLPASKRTQAAGRHRPTCRRPDRCAGCGIAYDRPRAFGLAASALDATELARSGMDRSDPTRGRYCFCLRGSAIGPHTLQCAQTGWVPAERLAAEPTNPAATLVTWLRVHLDWALSQDWAGELVADLTSRAATAGSRWPVQERPTRCAAPCPACDRLTLVRYAPRFYAGPVSIRCDATDCHEPLDEKLYAHYVRVLTDRFGGAA